VKGVSFPPLRASGNRTRESVRVLARPMNLGSRAIYRHGGRGPLSMKYRETLLIKMLMGETPRTRSSTEPDIEINPT
jgi:hypothetical protein